MTYICAPIFVTIPRDNGISVDFQPTGGVEVAIPSGPKGLDGVSPTIEVTDILGGHKVTITDVSGTEDFNVMDGGISESDFLKVFPTDTASGAVATFPDGADQVPLKTLTVDIDPVQNLNGYDNPWPAGGGKNIAYDVTYTSASSQYVTVIAGSFSIVSGKRYVFSFTTPNTGELVYRQSPSILGFSSLSGYSFTCDGGRKSFYGTASSTATLTDRSIVAKQQNDSIPVGLCSEFMIEEVEDTVTTPSDYAPYSNICPITGWTEAKVWVKSTHDTSSSPTVTITLNGTRYGGTLDVLTGVLTVDRANIASYNGETLPGEWISSMDVYAPGTTPTAGAQVVYELASSQTVQLTAQQVSSLLGANNVWADTGDVNVVYRADIGLFIDKKLNA